MPVTPSSAYLAIMTRVNSIILLAEAGDRVGVADGWGKLSASVSLIVTSK